jgi:hypothetical protein
MFILIPIPIGGKQVATVRGTVWKLVACAHCQQKYAYLLELEATGQAHDALFLDKRGAVEQARAHAAEKILQKSRNVVLPVPCPHCGFYQDDMSELLKDEVRINPTQVVGMLVMLVSLILLGIDFAHLWVLTVVLAATGLAVLIYGYVLAFRFDPNAGDPEPRKALGQKHAVWGKQLAELMAATADAGQSPASDQPCD